MERVISLLIGYVFGLLQSGYLYGKFVKNTDIRQHGSGNAGSTNILRVFGVKSALIVFLGDFFKAVVAMFIARKLFGGTGNGDLYAMYAGLGVTLGHDFPFYMNFKGGKGIASMAGILTAMDLRITAVCLLIFVAVVYLTRFVSLGSILVSIAFGVMNIYFCWKGYYNVLPGNCPEVYAITLFLTGLAIQRHHANIGRLLSGTENKISFSKK
ncbi:MAG: glycerol-3-phosphate 1-O-acyltransferase PlsY [Clostridium sp.]|jgi:glycerol-3-phosphate acyltransferase PlsY|nr:glycerol-3-phosphate 1-O-acyltransferase PlsY [Clostridium sp.]MBQ4149838.1 glycerol-3-phosphate 1-O-acyltransferase PlsY [Clostridium sp.]MBQ5420818.1 glycerol-3-phosphate 1-O-acyltransferase PlsY [Clostridium sp.]HAE80264.1 acyl-phosphate glycerol 3-phosphate acyltransferase [Lachnoclostridium sp.]